MVDSEQVTRFITALRALDCRFALDDFGSGLSSLAYLKTIPADYLKIDGHLVQDMVSNPIDRAMVEGIHRIGRVMGLRTVAEWVENMQTRRRLAAIGVDYAQGFGVAEPVLLSPSMLASEMRARVLASRV